jgi:hypothetical protein
MENDGSVNSQVVDSITGIVSLLTGQAPSQSFSFVDTVMAEAISVAMQNAVSRQQNAGMIGSAAVTATCAKILSVPFPQPVKVVPTPPAQTPPSVTPLSGPPSPSDVITAAFSQANVGIDILKAQANSAGDVKTAASDDLAKLITAASGTSQTSPTSPTETTSTTSTSATTTETASTTPTTSPEPPGS